MNSKDRMNQVNCYVLIEILVEVVLFYSIGSKFLCVMLAIIIILSYTIFLQYLPSRRWTPVQWVGEGKNNFRLLCACPKNSCFLCFPPSHVNTIQPNINLQCSRDTRTYPSFKGIHIMTYNFAVCRCNLWCVTYCRGSIFNVQYKRSPVACVQLLV